MAMLSNSLNCSYVTQKEKIDKNAIQKMMMKEELKRRKNGLLFQVVSKRMLRPFACDHLSYETAQL